MNIDFDVESPFSFEELFFSRTDRKGIIQSGNYIFQRVSEFEWDKILQAPHNLIRHPGMPRGVFHLLWETILSGQPIGAYVVNRSRLGKYYWVFALVIPVAEGFLSIRLKPGSPTFDLVRAKYAELVSAERAKKLSPSQSQALLIDSIRALGFEDYRSFMITALVQEMEHRNLQLSSTSSVKMMEHLKTVLQSSIEIQNQATTTLAAYRKSANIPLNLEIQAARLGEEAGSISVVSQHYARMSNEINEYIKNFAASSDRMRRRVEECRLLVCASLLEREMVESFRAETRDLPYPKEREIDILTGLSEQGIAAAKASLNEIAEEYARFKAVLNEVRQLSLGLEIVSVSGKLETAKISAGNQSLMDLLSELSAFKSQLGVSLNQVEQSSSNLINCTQQVQQSLTLD